MKKLFFSYILFAILLIACYKTNAQGVQVIAKVDSPTIKIGAQTKLRLAVHQLVKDKVNFPKLGDTIISKLQIVGTPKTDTIFDPADKTQATVLQSYTITSFDEGTYTIPAYSFGTAAGIVKSNEVILQVQTVKVDTTKGVYDIKQPIQVTYTFWDWLRDNWYWVAIPLVVIMAAIGVIYYLRKRPKQQKIIEVIKPSIPAHTQALAKLKELQDKKLWQQDAIKEYYIELSDVLREYLEKRYAIKTHEKTTDEIFDGLKRVDISLENKAELRQILVLSDLVKFAKVKPIPVENVQSMDDAINFVVKTQQSQRPSTVEGGAANV